MATVASMQATLEKYEAARDKILETGQSYKLDDREFTRADLRFIEAQIEKLESKIDFAQRRGRLKHSTAVFGGRR